MALISPLLPVVWHGELTEIDSVWIERMPKDRDNGGLPSRR